MTAFYPTDYLHPLSIAYWRYTLWRSQYYSPQRLESLQWHLLSRMLQHCRDKVPYYEKHLGPVRIERLEDLSAIPILNKDTVWQHPDEFKGRDFKRYQPLPDAGTRPERHPPFRGGAVAGRVTATSIEDDHSGNK